MSGATGKRVFGGWVEVIGGDGVTLPLHPGGPDGTVPKLLYASCPECQSLFVNVLGEGYNCSCKGGGAPGGDGYTFCPVRFGKVRVREL